MTTHPSRAGVFLLAALVSLVQLYGCGSKNSASSAAFNPAAAVVGTWWSDCLPIGTATSEMKTIVFTGETFKATTTNYTDAACKTTDNAIAGAGTYKIDGSLSEGTAGSLYNINYTYSSNVWTFTANPLQAVDYAKVCGSTALSGRVDILGKTCTLDAAAPTVFYSPSYGTVTFEGSTLLLSDLNANGGTDATRSTAITLGHKLGWTKQPDPVAP